MPPAPIDTFSSDLERLKKHSGMFAPSELRHLEREIAATDAEIDIWFTSCTVSRTKSARPSKGEAYE